MSMEQMQRQQLQQQQAIMRRAEEKRYKISPRSKVIVAVDSALKCARPNRDRQLDPAASFNPEVRKEVLLHLLSRFKEIPYHQLPHDAVDRLLELLSEKNKKGNLAKTKCLAAGSETQTSKSARKVKAEINLSLRDLTDNPGFAPLWDFNQRNRLEVLRHVVTGFIKNPFQNQPDGLLKRFQRLLSQEIEKSKSEDILLAEEVIKSLKIKQNGVARLVIPAGKSRMDLKNALNAYFKQECPYMDRPAIISLNESDPENCVKHGTARTIDIHVLVPGTMGKSKEDQAKVLKKRNMVFAPTADLALIVAAYSCKTGGDNLLYDNWVRSASEPDHAMTNDCDRHGVYVFRTDDSGTFHDIWAAGVKAA